MKITVYSTLTKLPRPSLGFLFAVYIYIYIYIYIYDIVYIPVSSNIYYKALSTDLAIH